MNVKIQPRAEVSLRSLDESQRKTIESALKHLAAADSADLRVPRSKFHRVRGARVPRSIGYDPSRSMRHGRPRADLLKKHRTRDGRNLYTFKAKPTLRLALSRKGNTWHVEDVVDREQLRHLAVSG